MGNNDVYLRYGDGCHRKKWNAEKSEWERIFYSCFTCPFPDCISNFSKFAMDNANNSMYKHYAIVDGVCCCAKCEHMWRLRSEVKVGKQCPHCGAMLITKNKFINKGDN